MQPIAQGVGVEIHNPLQIPTQKVQILDIFVDVFFFVDHPIALLLVKFVLDSALSIDVLGQDVEVRRDACGPHNHLVVFNEVVEELVQALPLVDIEVSVVLRVFVVEVVLAQRGQQVPVLIGCEGVDQSVIQLGDHRKFGVLFGWQQLGTEKVLCFDVIHEKAQRLRLFDDLAVGLFLRPLKNLLEEVEGEALPDFGE